MIPYLRMRRQKECDFLLQEADEGEPEFEDELEQSEEELEKEDNDSGDEGGDFYCRRSGRKRIAPDSAGSDCASTLSATSLLSRSPLESSSCFSESEDSKSPSEEDSYESSFVTSDSEGSVWGQNSDPSFVPDSCFESEYSSSSFSCFSESSSSATIRPRSSNGDMKLLCLEYALSPPASPESRQDETENCCVAEPKQPSDTDGSGKPSGLQEKEPGGEKQDCKPGTGPNGTPDPPKTPDIDGPSDYSDKSKTSDNASSSSDEEIDVVGCWQSSEKENDCDGEGADKCKRTSGKSKRKRASKRKRTDRDTNTGSDAEIAPGQRPCLGTSPSEASNPEPTDFTNRDVDEIPSQKKIKM